MQKRFNWILGVLLLALLATAIFLWYFHTSSKEIVGTFSSGDGISRNNFYIAFSSKNEFLIYRQHEDILNGVYTIEELGGNVIVRMTSEENVCMAIYNKRDSMLLVKTDSLDIYELARISDVPMIIGHKSNYFAPETG